MFRTFYHKMYIIVNIFYCPEKMAHVVIRNSSGHEINIEAKEGFTHPALLIPENAAKMYSVVFMLAVQARWLCLLYNIECKGFDISNAVSVYVWSLFKFLVINSD